MGNKNDTQTFKDLDGLCADLWKTMEHLIKSLKSMPGKLTGTEMKKTMWKAIERHIGVLRAMEERFACDQFYKWTDGEKYIILRVDSFSHNDSDDYRPLKMNTSILTSTEEKWDYKEIKDTMFFSYTDFSAYHTLEKIDLKFEDLPLYLGNKWKGRLYRDLLSNEMLSSEDAAEAKSLLNTLDAEEKEKEDEE